jgi:hypothetical protein
LDIHSGYEKKSKVDPSVANCSDRREEKVE